MDNDDSICHFVSVHSNLSAISIKVIKCKSEFQYDCSFMFLWFASFPYILFPILKKLDKNIRFPFSEYDFAVYGYNIRNSFIDLSFCVCLLYKTETIEIRQRKSYVRIISSRYKLKYETNDEQLIECIQISCSSIQ